jgi:hypothetical protein
MTGTRKTKKGLGKVTSLAFIAVYKGVKAMKELNALFSDP